ncbi:tetratricopeptide repeat protein [Streptomyces sp. ISL-44]|uniref:tetratricopeptide repeat protein n=1 Tax=Streptomyces sp. ISL-44 TaxID=2819184 RepID=UPI001BE94229|nr:tetratricopeptide repeat protein [Streptomyces sp. ISL-44]MBT2543594.1 tetratricopeptide repeat protein [Streptomyces sp. ISL-44]
MYLGAPHAITFRYEDGALTGILLGLHRKPTLALREELLSPYVSFAPLPPNGPAESPLRQALGTGFRDIELDAGPDKGTTVLRQRFDLREPMEWCLRVDAAGRPGPGGAAFTLPDEVKLSVETTAPFTVDRGAMRVRLPAGTSEVNLTVTSRPVFAAGDTIVVCRPDQLREAAIVASCLPGDRLTPVIAIEPPPVPREHHIDFYELHQELERKVMAGIGTDTAGAQALAGGPEAQREVLQRLADLRWLASMLTPYRSWAKRNEMTSRLISRMGIRRAVFLHDFAPQELGIHDPALDDAYDRYAAANGRVPDDDDGRMFADVPVKLRLTGVGLRDLTTAAWRLLRDPDPGSEPERVLEVPVGDPSCYVSALFTALRTGAALRAVDRPSTPPGDPFADAGPASGEAVLVENTGDAATLLGALYAHHRGARLVVTPPPDLEPVQRAVARLQSRVTDATRAMGNEAKGLGFGEALRRILFFGGRNPYAETETAVTAQVPQATIDAVGERRLTAFTTGLPYSFVRTGTANWSRKPIGHVAADAALIVLTELYAAGVERQAGTFSLVLDPEFFRASETEDVLRSVGAHFTHPILLNGRDASMLALRTLAGDLPVELLFFNTHGGDNSIELADMPLETHQLVQLFKLDHRPIVFNNSCQSWTGVGREFIRIGARGYIGTLWDIPARPAADFARVVMDRLTAQQTPAAEAIVGTGAPQGIDRSYIYVGTVNGRLDQWPDQVTGGEAVLAHCLVLGRVALKFLNRTSGSRSVAVQVLYREMTALRRTVEGTEHARTLAYVDALVWELRLAWLLAQSQGEQSDDIPALIAQIDETLEELDLPAPVTDRRRADRFELAGLLHQQSGARAEALADLELSMRYRPAGENRANVLLVMASLLMSQGDYDRALRSAGDARDLFTEQHDDQGLMRTLGTLGPLMMRFGRYPEAMAYAEQGHALAVRLEGREDQASFLLQRSTLHQVDGDFDTATTEVIEALETYRSCQDERGELSALRTLTACYRGKGDLRAAGGCSLSALALAKKLGARTAVAECHDDLGQVYTLMERHAEALPHYREAVSAVVGRGATEVGSVFLAHLVDCAIRLGDADALWAAAGWGTTMCAEGGERQWSRALPEVVGAVKEALLVGSPDTLPNQIATFVMGATSADPESLPDHMSLLNDFAVLVLKWLTNEDPAATVSRAQRMDASTQGALGLAEFVTLPYEVQVLRHKARGG